VKKSSKTFYGGGTGNDGGAVSVTNAGGITTQGMQAYGIFAQSVGGGGGTGGSSYDFNAIAALSKAFNKNSNNSGLNLTESVSVGGNGKGGGNGGAVTVNNSGAITTYGSSAYGIFAQSIGGGGGSASTIGGPWNGIKFLQYFGFGVDVGRQGGSGGSGNTVTVANNSNIATTGDNANGIFAQSIGGAGGAAPLLLNFFRDFYGMVASGRAPVAPAGRLMSARPEISLLPAWTPTALWLRAWRATTRPVMCPSRLMILILRPP